MSRNREYGAGRTKTILSLLILAAMVYVAVKVIPPYVNNFELQDAMKTEARFAAVNRKSSEEVREDVYKKIKELGIPAKAENIRVEGLPNSGMRITVTYKVVVDLPGYGLVLNFEPTADNTSI
jgi:hypothetical protein